MMDVPKLIFLNIDLYKPRNYLIAPSTLYGISTATISV